MALDLFDFCPDSRVAEEIPPDPQTAMSMNGWDFTAKPAVPYRAKFNVTLSGLRWLLNDAGDALDLTTDSLHNAGRLREFYKAHQTWSPFLFNHEFLGQLTVRFATVVQIPRATMNSNGLIPDFQFTLVHHNPSF